MIQRTDAPVAAATPTRARPPWRAAFSSLQQYPGFRLLWLSTLFISGGNRIQQVTIGWLAYQMTESALQVGAVTGLRALPLLFGPMAGVLADRVERRKMLLANHAYLSIVSVGFAILVLLDIHQVWHLYAFTLLTGVSWSLSHPVRQALVANSVPREALMNAVALNSMAFNSSRILGPAIGGGLIALAGPGVNFLVQGLVFALVFVVILPFRPLYASDPSRAARSSALSSLRDGFRYVVKDHVLMAAMSATLLSTLFITSFTMALMPVYAAEVVGTGPGGLGLLFTAMGVGGLSGALLVAAMGNIRRTGVVALGAMALAGFAIIIFSQVTMLWLAMGVLGVVGVFQVLALTSNNTIVQLTTPDELRGRVLGIYMLDMGMIPLGALMAGTLAEFLGAPTALLVGGAMALALAGLVMVVAPKYRALRM